MMFLRILLVSALVLCSSANLIAKEQPLSFDAELSNYQYDLPVQFFNFSSQNTPLKMAYSYLKPSNNMPTVILMHGKNFNGHYWTNTANYLNSKGYGVLIPDQIGFGKSSKPADYQFSFAVLANNTHQLVSSLNIENPIVLGHSMGGMLASRYSLMFSSQVSKLILLNPIGLENYLNYVQYKDTDFFYKNELAKTPDKVIAYQKKNYYDGKWNDTYEQLTHFISGQIQGPDHKQVAWVNAKTYDMIFTQPVITEFAQLSMPVSLIIGTRDRTGPGRNWKKANIDYELGRYDKLGKAAASMISKSQLIELDDIGHLPHIEDFDRFKGALDKALSF
ncbi:MULTISPECIES: alpha/beta hydrolase [unclassified Pseudoalteromonas]|uniref:alpha/beta fold hydrolase n=1 Tax=Pseudoalteromonas TaxID=53246 RepID=UPI00110B40D9|nr:MULTISPECIES: alpha/beta hydrolase [unclassified Pseudoalteromonas]MBC7007680.1 alpha/beta hydrolase [Pseudoalteromonas sp. BZK2]TMP42042.1 alpha/beta hydrolase [Pseudoalteromonas sp. S1650]TMP66889.1 alpha/beta hydrolase [Pseudoalteromonas sp. S1649]